MAGINQVFSLADDFVRSAKACSKKSILQTKSIKPTKLESIISIGAVEFPDPRKAPAYIWFTQHRT